MTIKPNTEYNLKQIRDERMIPWALHYQTLRRIIENGEILASWEGEKRQRRYFIRGSSIINYKKQYLIALSKK